MKAKQIFCMSVLFVLGQVNCLVVTRQCPGGGYEKSIFGWMLQGHIYKTIEAELPQTCLFACRKDHRCQSFNWVISVHLCEFNNRTKEARPDDFVSDPDRFYFRRYKDRDVDECSASSPVCDVNANCTNTRGSYLCTCKTGFSGDGKTCKAALDCLNYQSLTSGDRKVSQGSSPPLCDNSLNGWYRFQGNAGTKMPTSCVPTYRCGTHATGWLDGTHPSVEEGKVTRRVCFNWSPASCCTWAINIQVLNCGDYFLYHFRGTPPEHPCHLRYCGTD